MALRRLSSLVLPVAAFSLAVLAMSTDASAGEAIEAAVVPPIEEPPTVQGEDEQPDTTVPSVG